MNSNSFGTLPHPQHNQQFAPLDKSNVSSDMRFLKIIAVLILLVQIGIFAFMFISSNIYQYSLNQQIINEVSKLTPVNPSETPVTGVVTDVAALKKQSPYYAEVYKDAQNGDYILGYNNKMIIYRRSDSKIIYDGDNPANLQTKLEQNLVLAIVAKAKAASIIDSSSNEVPQVSQISDLNQVTQQNPDFYADAQVGDAIALFSKEKMIVLYRPSSDTIVKAGPYNFQIQ